MSERIKNDLRRTVDRAVDEGLEPTIIRGVVIDQLHEHRQRADGGQR